MVTQRFIGRCNSSRQEGDFTAAMELHLLDSQLD